MPTCLKLSATAFIEGIMNVYPSLLIHLFLTTVLTPLVLLVKGYECLQTTLNGLRGNLLVEDKNWLEIFAIAIGIMRLNT